MGCSSCTVRISLFVMTTFLCLLSFTIPVILRNAVMKRFRSTATSTPDSRVLTTLSRDDTSWRRQRGRYPPTKLPLSPLEMDASLQSAGNWASLKPTAKRLMNRAALDQVGDGSPSSRDATPSGALWTSAARKAGQIWRISAEELAAPSSPTVDRIGATRFSDCTIHLIACHVVSWCARMKFVASIRPITAR